MGLPLVAAAIFLFGVLAAGFTSYSGEGDSRASSSSANRTGSGDSEILGEVEEVLSQTESLRGRLNQRIQSSIQVAQDEKQKTVDVEERFNELRDQPFESAARKFIQDDNLPEPVRKEMKQLVNEVEDMEEKEGSLLQVIKQVEKEEEFELQELEEAGVLEQKVEKELEEVAEDEAEAERRLSDKKEKIREIEQDMRKSIQTYRQALKRGDRKTAQKAKQNLLEDRNRLEEIRNRVSQFAEDFGNTVMPILSDVKSQLGQVGSDLRDVRGKSEEVEEDLEQEEDIFGSLDDEATDEREKLDEEEAWFERIDNDELEEDLFTELGSDASEAADEAEDEGEIVEEEEGEQQDIEEEEELEEEVFNFEETAEKDEEREAENIQDEAEEIVEEADEALEESSEVINEGEQMEGVETEEFGQALSDLRDANEKFLWNNRMPQLGFPYYYGTVFEEIADKIENLSQSGQINMRDAVDILDASKAGVMVVKDAMGSKRVADIYHVIDNSPDYGQYQPVWRGEIDIGRFSQIKKDPQNAQREVESEISSTAQKANDKSRTPAPINKALDGARKGDNLVKAINNTSANNDLAASVFVAECLVKAVDDALRDEALVARMNETVF